MKILIKVSGRAGELGDKSPGSLPAAPLSLPIKAILGAHKVSCGLQQCAKSMIPKDYYQFLICCENGRTFEEHIRNLRGHSEHCRVLCEAPMHLGKYSLCGRYVM